MVARIAFAASPDETRFIHPTLHSAFGEFIGSLIYDGTWVGRESVIPQRDGIRQALIDGLREAGIAALRWPGGCTADHYHWMDGVGPIRKKRMPYSPVQQDKFYHDFGTDEFLRLCELAEAEPILVANTATGTPEEFAAWVEYCNGDTETRYGSLRAANGHPAPYHVRAWGLGNTDENVWWAAYNDPIQYARDFRRFRTAAMGCGLTFIGLGLSLRHETPGWVEPCLDYMTAGGRQQGPDALSVHHYIGGAKGKYRACGDAVAYSDAAYHFTLDALTAYQQDIDYHKQAIQAHACPAFPVGICFDEWGLWHPEATEENGFRQRQTMRDAMFAAMALHLFYRNSDSVRYAMETQYVNVLQSLFETRGPELARTPTFYVFKLFRDHLGKRLLPCQPERPNPMLDCAASRGEGELVVTLAHRDLYACAEVALELPLGARLLAADVIAPRHVRAQNTIGSAPEVFDRPLPVRDGEFVLPPHSVARLRYACAPEAGGS